MIKVFLVDDHTIIQEGIRCILNAIDDIQVVLEADGKKSFLNKQATTTWDILILDITLKDGLGLEILEWTKENYPTRPIIVFTNHNEDIYVKKVLKEGALGYVLKDSTSDDLIKAIYSVHKKEQYITPALKKRLAFHDRLNLDSTPERQLSRREFQVLRMLASGLSPKQMGEELQINPKTISTYVHRIKTKLKVETQAELIKFAIENSLVN